MEHLISEATGTTTGTGQMALSQVPDLLGWSGTVEATPTRLRQSLSVSVHGNMSVLTMYLASFAVVSAQLSCVTF
jgi:hypothetical protein